MKGKLIIGRKVELQLAIEHILERNLIYRSCLTCDNFDEAKELCKLANQRPPAKIIATACPQWHSLEDVPF